MPTPWETASRTGRPARRLVWAVGALAWAVAGGWTVGAVLQFWRYVPGLLGSEVLFFALPAAVFLWRWRRQDAEVSSVFGRPSAREWGWSVILAAAVAVAGAATGVAVRHALGLPVRVSPLSPGLVLVWVGVAPLAETLLFRVVLQRTLAAVWRPGTALAVTAVAFGLIQGSGTRFAETLLLGVFSGVVWVKTGRFWAGAGFHAAVNGAGLLLWPALTRLPVWLAGLVAAGGAAVALIVAGYWLEPAGRLRSWRDRLRWALVGANLPPPEPAPAGRAAGWVLGGMLMGMAALNGVVALGEWRDARAHRLSGAGAPEVRQRDEWRLEAEGRMAVRSRIEFTRWPVEREGLTFALAYPQAEVLQVWLAGEELAVRPLGAGTFGLVWPQPMPPPGTLEVYWRLPLSALDEPEHGFRVRLQALVPVHAFALRLTLSPDCGYVFERAPERPEDLIFSTTWQRPARRDFGSCGLGLRPTQSSPADP